MADGGYIKLFRQIEEWRFWDRPMYTQVWLHLLIKVNWKEVGYKYGEKLGPGETIITLRGFAEECGLSKTTLSRVLQDLEKERQIETYVGQGRTHIKVLNYAVFQASEDVPWDKRWDTKWDTKWDTDQDTYPYYKNIRSKEVKKREEAPKPPTLSEIKAYIHDEKLTINAEKFYQYYSARKWRNVPDWKAKAKEWQATERQHKNADLLPEYMTERKRRKP